MLSSTSLCLGRAAVCDCGTPWSFLFFFFFFFFFFPVIVAHPGLFSYHFLIESRHTRVLQKVLSLIGFLSFIPGIF